MSDESFPPPQPPLDDEPRPDPDEHGYGHYDVEEYSGVPGRPADDTADDTADDAADDIAADADDPGEPLDPFAAPPTPYEPESYEPDSYEPEPDDEVEAVVPARAGRVTFAERNWRIPTIIALVVAMVVLGTIVLLLPDDGIVQDGGDDLVELREQPLKSWDEDLDGFASGFVSDRESLYVIVAKRSTTELTAFDLSSGDERWTLDLGPGTTATTGDLALIDDDLIVIVDGAPGTFAIVDPAGGKVRWQAALSARSVTIEDAGFLRSADPAGGWLLTPIDHAEERFGEALRVDASFVVGDDVYTDIDGTLSRRSVDDFVIDDGFSFTHDTDIAAILAVGDEVVLATGEAIVRLGADGEQRWSYDAGIGIVRSLLPMQADVVLANSSTRMRAIAIDDEQASPITGARSGVAPIRIQEIDGEELIVAFAGVDRGQAAGSIRAMRIVDEAFEQAAEFAITSSDGAPELTAAGSIAYLTSFDARSPRLVAHDLTSGEQLWSLALVDDDRVDVGSAGIVVMTREDDESIATFYAAGE